jgi:murein tripeptide amidase MpaA
MIPTRFLALAAGNPNRMEFIPSIGKTQENRDIIAIRVFGDRSTSENLPQIFIQGGIHAREWISRT